MLEQQGEEAAQPVLGVGGGPGDDPDLPELGEVLFGHPLPVMSALVVHRSLRRARVSQHRPVTVDLPATKSEESITAS